MERIFRSSVVLFFVLLLLTGLSFAQNVENGKKLFNDPSFGSSTNDKSCNSCHPNGKGLEQSGKKEKIIIMGKELHSLEEAVNMCIEGPLSGKAIKIDSQEMKDIVAYIKSLTKN
ncbi:MAG: hypothetical protein L3V56_10495 [Candidatus Magnetoovum sp. WYHC-5]|nr:hypothetical protein [Candidatus Magnetoovum sp. WYHC-5]